MSKNLYIAAYEPDSGKSLVVLGIMNVLSRHVKRVGFFRPIVRLEHIHDHDIELIRGQFNLPFHHDTLYGLTSEEAYDLIQAGNMDELFTGILNKYKKLEADCDFILIEGTDHKGSMKSLEFGFNARLANNLGAPVFVVVNGNDKNVTDVADTYQLIRSELAEEKCHFLGLLVNRVRPADLGGVKEVLGKFRTGEEVSFVVPELDVLQKLTVRQVSTGLKADMIYGGEDVLDYDVNEFKIAAMGLENILRLTGSGTMVITPGDRSDILVALFMTLLSKNYPKITGIILTGGFDLSPGLATLLEGIARLPVAMMKVDTDTMQTALNVTRIKPSITPGNERRIAFALGHFDKHVNARLLRDKIIVTPSSIVTPVMFEYQLYERARSSRKHIVLPEGLEERILRATEILLRRDVVELTLLGNETDILQKAASLHIKLTGVNIIDPYDNDLINDYSATYYKLRKEKGVTRESAVETMRDVSYLGTMMVYKGHADGMVSGSVHTTQHTIRPAFEFVKTKPGFSIVSSCFLMCFDDRVLVYGDCAVNPNPNSEQLADIAINSADTAKMFGIEPRVAMLSYSTGTSGKGEEVEKVRTATEIARKRRPDLLIEGPIQYDAAIDATVAQQKMPGSEVAGKATVYIFPDLNTGNNTYKAVQRASNVVAVGPVLQGLNKPVNDLSRGCLVKDIVNTVLITAIQAQEQDVKSK